MRYIFQKLYSMGYEYNKQADVYNLLACDLTILACCLFF